MDLKIKDIKSINPQTVSIIFHKPENFTFYPGQFIDLEIKDDTRSFSIASAPSEEHLIITTKLGISEFKKNILSLKQGDTLKSSHPAGTFTLEQTSPGVFIAGGIGITPFRSMIKHNTDLNLKSPITLIYSNSNHEFIYKDDLENWQVENPNLQITFLNSAILGRLDTPKLKQILNFKLQDPNTIYYIAGSPNFVKDMQKGLLEHGVDEINIRSDEFDGYE